jgi:FkbM family methyltransferase
MLGASVAVAGQSPALPKLKQGSVLQSAKAHAWLAYRRGRRIAASMMGANPLYTAATLMDRKREHEGIVGLIKTQSAEINRFRSAPDYTRDLWMTPLGSLWAPRGATQHFVRMIVGEMMAGVYPLDGLKPGSVVLDVGANIGAFSRWAQLHGAERVICMEPSPPNIACLRRNVQAAEIYEAGAWDKHGSVSFASDNKTNPGSHFVCDGERANRGGNETISVMPIDAMRLGRVDYIKMDIEGSEVRALRGAKETIQRFRPQLAIATEHTKDIVANTAEVIRTVREIYPSYNYVVTESQWITLNGRRVLTPYTLYFTCERETLIGPGGQD